ncbi:MAG: HDOD domain-containing protein [Candidatus Accumulibacter sp.]|jgi:putative nucleotidyltransferase with HDIG domain|nr:HDOD domain-containing protein [Accumulibacter sp.]
MTAPSLEQLLDHAKALPSPPEVVTYLIRALRDDMADLETLTRHMNSDPAIAARLLASANLLAPSGLSQRVHSVAQAFMLLGADRVIDIILASSLIHRYDDRSSGFIAPLFWRHSLGVATCAQVIARQTGINPEMAFIGGLLHDIGRLLMYTASPCYVHQALDYRQRGDTSMIAAEREVFGYDHCQVGRMLASSWKLPSIIGDAIAAHHEPDEFGNEICDIVHIGECLSHALDLGEIESNRVPDLSDLACARIGLSWPKFSACFAEIEARFDDFLLSLRL